MSQTLESSAPAGKSDQIAGDHRAVSAVAIEKRRRRLIERHARLGAFVRAQLKAMGLKLLVRDEARASNTVTAFWAPEAFTPALLDRLADVGMGHGPEGRTWKPRTRSSS